MVGRSRNADLRVADATVSRLHAELTLTEDGRCYLTDRRSRRGTMVSRDGSWIEHRAGFVDLNAAVRFGDCETDLASLLVGNGFRLPAGAPARDQPPEEAWRTGEFVAPSGKELGNH